MRTLLAFILGIISIACIAAITTGPNTGGTNVINAITFPQSPLVATVNGAGNSITNVVNFAGGTTATTMATVNGVKVYRALLAQVGTGAPTATVLENSLGGSVVYARSSEGIYTATLTGAFPLSKTIPSIGYTDDGWQNNSLASVFRSDDNMVTIQTGFIGIGGADDEMSATWIQILVYP